PAPSPVGVASDVRRAQAGGEEGGPPEDAEELPEVTRAEDGRPEVTIPDEDPPSQLRVVTLIKGEGPQIQEGGSLTAHYTSVEWSSGDDLDSTWGEKLTPPAIPSTRLIPAWQGGLSDATRGAPTMLMR